MNGKLLVLCALLVEAAVEAAPLSTAINYQGRLDDNGSPANGTYSFRFRLLGDSSGTTQIGPVVDIPSQILAEGVLTAPLDFGAGAFNDQARWLEISVKAGGPGAAGDYVKLNPQPLLPAGSSQFARVAGDVLNGTITGAKLAPLAITTTHISDGAVTAPKLGPASITGGNVADNAITAAKIASGQVVKSLNGLWDSVSLAAGANVTLTPSGNTLTIASAGGGGPWTLLNANVYYNAGNVGIGTSNPQRRLQVGDANVPNSEGMIRLASRSGVDGNLRVWDIGVPETESDAAFGYHFVIDDTHRAGTDPEFIIRWDTGNVGIGTIAPQAKLDVSGTTRTSVLEITGGSDLAEPFPMKEEQMEKGSVVVIDADCPGRLKRSTHAYDTCVAGIVSGANGINPGIALKQEGALDQGEHVSLSGRVYVKADAAYGAIQPGNLLTTSDTAGHAMKVSDHVRAQGAILGKAMSKLDEGTGFVLVLVTLQ